MDTPSLFDSSPRTTAAPLPRWLWAALRKFGFSKQELRSMHLREAYARLYTLRSPGRPSRDAVAERVRAVVGDPDPLTPRELYDLVTEAASPLTESELRRVVGGLLNLLREPSSSA